METIGGGGGRTTDAEDITEGTFTLARLPTMDDDHIPDLETLSYGGTFGTAQIPDLPTVKITSGTFDSDRIPILPTDRYGSAVLLTGDQTIGGTKTFGDIPILPASDPTSDNEAARKAYVDAQGGGGIGTHANEYHDPDMLCTDGSNAMAGTLTLGSHTLEFNNMKLFEADADWLYLTDIAGSSFKAFKAYTLNTSHGQIFYGVHLMFDFYTTYIVAMKDLNMGNNKIFNLLDPTADQHAATKYYVDRHPKTLWVPVTYGTTMGNYGYYPVARLAGLFDSAHISFCTPHDFHSITEAHIAVIPRATQAAADWDIHASYAAVGEAYNNHVGHDAASTYNVTNNQIFEVDISTILTSLAAGDYVGVDIELGDAAHDVDVLGVMFKYT